MAFRPHHDDGRRRVNEQPAATRRPGGHHCGDKDTAAFVTAVPREIGVLAATALLLPVKYVVEKTLVFTRRDAGQPLGATPRCCYRCRSEPPVAIGTHPGARQRQGIHILGCSSYRSVLRALFVSKA